MTVSCDVRLGFAPGDIVGILMWRRFEKVTRRIDDCTLKAVIECEFGAADGINHHPGGIRRIPHLKLEFEIEGDVSEGLAFHAEMAPFAVLEPGDVVGGTHVDVVGAHVVWKHGRNGARLGYFFGFKPLPLEHV